MANSGPPKPMHFHHPIPINTISKSPLQNKNQQTNKTLLFLSFLFPSHKDFEMAKMCKLTKLKSAIKRWPSLTRVINRSSTIAADNYDHDDNTVEDTRIHRNDQLREVFVGKSRRLYLLSSNIICHPLFQELVDDDDEEEEVVVACEVVLFEHLLWMIEAGGTDQLDSMEELAQFYVLQQ